MTDTKLIIIHYGQVDLTVKCLESVYADKDAPSAIIVDNSLNPELSTRIRHFDQCELVTPDTNLGFVGGNNLGIRKALAQKSKFIILLNNDTLIPEGFFKKIRDFALQTPSAGIIAPKIYFAKGYEYHKTRYQKNELGRVIWFAGGKIDWNNIIGFHRGVDEVDHGQYDDIEETDFNTGCALLINKKVVEKIGLFDEKYFLYYEDVDFSIRVKRAGFSVIYYPETFIWHKNAGSSQGPGSPLHQYYQARNRLYFGFKFAEFRTKLALARESLKHISGGGIKRKAVFDFYLGRMGQQQL